MSDAPVQHNDPTRAGSGGPPSQIEQRKRVFRRWLQSVEARPYQVDLFQLLRRIEAAYPELPRLGSGRRPSEEPVRVRQPAELNFAPAAVQGITSDAQGRVLVDQRVFGLMGPFGPLPTHLTEFVRERQRHHADPTLQRWMDLLAQRFALLFYRAWADAQADAGDPLRSDEPAMRRIGSLAGIGLPQLRNSPSLPDSSRLSFAGRLSSRRRSLEGLQAWCRAEFGLPVELRPWSGHWMRLERTERSRLGCRRNADSQLGRGAVLGKSIWDVQHRFLIHIGPLQLQQYRSFLPGGPALARLNAMVLSWVGLEFGWGLELSLKRDEFVPLRLGGRDVPYQRLGLDSWLGQPPGSHDLADLRLDIQDRLAGHAGHPTKENFRP